MYLFIFECFCKHVLFKCSVAFFSVVEDTYYGPRLEENGNVSVEFMDSLMLWYKEQKTLHKKYAFQVLNHTFYVLVIYNICHHHATHCK